MDLHTPGAKDDFGKIRYGLVLKGFANALTEVAQLGTIGAAKYTPFGFLEVENGYERYEDAGLRHQFKAWLAGSEDEKTITDEETNIRELTCVAWNALAKLELAIRESNQTKGKKQWTKESFWKQLRLRNKR